MEEDTDGVGWGRRVCLRVVLLVICTGSVQANVETTLGNQFSSITDLCSGSGRGQTTRVLVGSVITSIGDREVNCEVTFQTDTILQKFMLRFERLQLDCNDHLWIYDSAYSSGPPLKDLSCRDTLNNVKTIYTHSNHVTFKYMTDEWGPATNGFKLIITAFKHKNSACRQFRCQTTNFCIDRSLVCDSVNHCGDGSDESTTFATCPSPPLGELLGMSESLLVATVTGGALLLCGLGLAVVICIHRRNRPRQQQQQHGQPIPTFQMDSGGTTGTNGTFGTVLAEKPPPYPGVMHHTSLAPPGHPPGNLWSPAFGKGSSLLALAALTRCYLPL